MPDNSDNCLITEKQRTLLYLWPPGGWHHPAHPGCTDDDLPLHSNLKYHSCNSDGSLNMCCISGRTLICWSILQSIDMPKQLANTFKIKIEPKNRCSELVQLWTKERKGWDHFGVVKAVKLQKDDVLRGNLNVHSAPRRDGIVRCSPFGENWKVVRYGWFVQILLV